MRRQHRLPRRGAAPQVSRPPAPSPGGSGPSAGSGLRAEDGAQYKPTAFPPTYGCNKRSVTETADGQRERSMAHHVIASCSHAYNAFRRTTEPDLICVVRSDYVVPNFIRGSEWELALPRAGVIVFTPARPDEAHIAHPRRTPS